MAPGTERNLVRDRLARSIDYPLLTAAGWNPATQTLAPDRGHRLLGYPVCRVAGCELEAWDRGGLCTGCRDRFRVSGGTGVEAFCQAASAARTARVTGGAWSAGSPASSVPSGPAICA